MLTVASTLLCISALLSQPNADDPLNEGAAEALRRSPVEFQRTAREWTRRYAWTAASNAEAHGPTGHLSVGAAAAANLGANTRRTGMAAEDDVSLDPMATYQTARGRVVDEEEALERALRHSSLQQQLVRKPCAAKPRGEPSNDWGSRQQRTRQ